MFRAIADVFRHDRRRHRHRRDAARSGPWPGSSAVLHGRRAAGRPPGLSRRVRGATSRSRRDHATGTRPSRTSMTRTLGEAVRALSVPPATMPAHQWRRQYGNANQP